MISWWIHTATSWWCLYRRETAKKSGDRRAHLRVYVRVIALLGTPQRLWLLIIHRSCSVAEGQRTVLTFKANKIRLHAVLSYYDLSQCISS
jgi:hypothetical protein